MFGVSALAQGLVTWSTAPSKVPEGGKILDPDGNAIQGAGGWAQLWVGADEGSLAPVANSLINFVNSAAGAGYVSSSAGLDIGFAAGQSVKGQVVAWMAGADSYEAAVAAGLGAGKSIVFDLAGTVPPDTPANLVNFRAFQLEVAGTGTIPEPSTIALGLIGAMGLMLRRRR